MSDELKNKQISKHNIGAKIYVEHVVFDYGFQSIEVDTGTFIELNSENFIYKDILNIERMISISMIKAVYKPGEKIL